MAEPFNVEQFRQQMRGQVPQGQQPVIPQPPQVQPGQAQYPQGWTPPVQAQHVQLSPQMQQHLAPAPVFAPPPSAMLDEQANDVKKKSKFSLKRSSKVKTPKVKKVKTKKAEDTHRAKKSPAMIFMFGMAAGVGCALAGSMLMSSLVSDNSAQKFRDIERQNARAQQPVLPKQSPSETKAVAEATVP